MQAKCNEELKKETEAYPQFANFEEGSVEPTSEVPDGPSAAGTPGQPKLKLTFNNAGGANEEEEEEDE